MKRSIPFLLLCLLVLPLSGFGETRGMTVEDMLRLKTISELALSPSGSHLAYTVSQRFLEDNRETGEVWVMDLATGESTRISVGGEGEGSPAWSPDGRYLALTSDKSGKNQVWIVPFAPEDEEEQPRQVTDLSTGASSPRWTPDRGKLIFTSRVFPDCKDDGCNRDTLKQKEEDPVKAELFTHLMYRHWDHWLDGRVSHLFSLNLKNRDLKDLMLGDTWGVTGGWDLSPDGACLIYTTKDPVDQEQNTNNDLYTVPVTAKGCDGERFTDNPALDEGPIFSPDGKVVAYLSHTRPGHESDLFQLTLKALEPGSAPVKLTGGLDRWVEQVGWFPSGQRLWFTIGDQGRSALYTALAQEDPAPARILTGGELSDIVLSPKGDRFYFVKQSLTEAMEIWTCNADGGDLKALTGLNHWLQEEVKLAQVEDFWWNAADGTRIHGFLLLPPGVTKEKKNPFLLLIHGGPQGMWTDQFHPRWNAQVFAAPGYLTLLANPRGSCGYGQEFVDQVSRSWGDLPYTDLMAGVDELIRLGWVDPQRMAAGGGSFGGYMANWILGNTDRFKCLFSHAGVYDLVSMYGSTEELWFPNVEYGGAPWDVPEDYEKFSPSKLVKNFKTPTMVIHGAFDFRVPLNQAMQLFTALQVRRIPSKFLYFPDESHFVQKARNTQLWYTEIHKWLKEWLGD